MVMGFSRMLQLAGAHPPGSMGQAVAGNTVLGLPPNVVALAPSGLRVGGPSCSLGVNRSESGPPG